MNPRRSIVGLVDLCLLLHVTKKIKLEQFLHVVQISFVYCNRILQDDDTIPGLSSYKL